MKKEEGQGQVRRDVSVTSLQPVLKSSLGFKRVLTCATLSSKTSSPGLMNSLRYIIAHIVKDRGVLSTQLIHYFRSWRLEVRGWMIKLENWRTGKLGILSNFPNLVFQFSGFLVPSSKNPNTTYQPFSTPDSSSLLILSSDSPEGLSTFCPDS